MPTAQVVPIRHAHGMPRQSAQIIEMVPARRRASPRKKPEKKHHHRKASGKLSAKSLMAAAIGGAALGYVDKNFPNIPTIPMLGRAGTIALVAYFLSSKGSSVAGFSVGSIARDVAIAGAGVAGYELGHDGKVSGVGGDVVPQVSGHRVRGNVASQV